jgi:hypothetical protein
VVTYFWPEESVAASQRSSFIRSLGSFTGDGSVPVVLLINDSELAQMLGKAGTGLGLEMQLDGIAEVDGPRREGAVVKSELRSKRPSANHVQEVNPTTNAPKTPSKPIKSSLLNPRAEAALRVLNPKSGK